MKGKKNISKRINIIIVPLLIVLFCLVLSCSKKEQKFDATKVHFPDNITTGTEFIDALDSVIDVVPILIRQSNNGDVESGKKIDQIVDVLSKVDFENLDFTTSQGIKLVSMSRKIIPILREIMPDGVLLGLLSLL